MPKGDDFAVGAWSIEIVIMDGNMSESLIQHPLAADINSECSWGPKVI